MTCLIKTCGLNLKTPSFKVLNHIIQHFWSCTILNEDHNKPPSSNNDCLNSTDIEYPASIESLENIEFELQRKHAGWAIKRARDLVQSGCATLKIQVSKADDLFCEVSKQRLLDDVLVESGKFLFIPKEEVFSVFLCLHSLLEKMVKSSLETSNNRDVLKECLEAVSKDKHLLDLWYGALHQRRLEDLSLKASYVLILQKIVAMFVKSKQQIIRKQLLLKPQKQSSTMRQSLKKVTDNQKGRVLVLKAKEMKLY